MKSEDPEQTCIVTGKNGSDPAHILSRNNPSPRYNPEERQNIHFLNRELHNYYDSVGNQDKLNFWFNHGKFDCYLWLSYLLDTNLKKPNIDWYYNKPGPKGRKRTTEQNKGYWFLVKILSDYTGYSTSKIHDMAKIDVWGQDIFEFDGREYIVSPDSKNRKTWEFSVLIEQLYVYGEKLGIDLPVLEKKT